LARFWRAFGISGGGLKPPTPPQYATGRKEVLLMAAADYTET